MLNLLKEMTEPSHAPASQGHPCSGPVCLPGLHKAVLSPSGRSSAQASCPHAADPTEASRDFHMAPKLVILYDCMATQELKMPSPMK